MPDPVQRKAPGLTRLSETGQARAKFERQQHCGRGPLLGIQLKVIYHPAPSCRERAKQVARMPAVLVVEEVAQSL